MNGETNTGVLEPPAARAARARVFERLRQKDPALAGVSDEELLRRLRRTQPEVARALDDVAGVPRSRLLDAVLERDPELRQKPRHEVVRKLAEVYPDLAQRDPNLLKEAAIDAPKPAWVQGVEYPQSLEPSRGGVPVYRALPSAPEMYQAWQQMAQQEAQKYQPESQPNVVAEALKSPPARVAAGLVAGLLGLVEAPIGLAGYSGAAINRMVKRWVPGLADPRPEDEWALNRAAGALDRAQEYVLRLTDDPDAGWVRNFFERVLPQGAASMLGFAKGGQWLVRHLGLRPGPAVATVGGIQGANEALEKAQAAGASDEDTLKNVLLGFGLGTTEVVPIAKWLARSGAARPLIKHLYEGVEEGVQEVVQQAGMQAGAKLTYDPKASLTEGLAEAGLGGVVLGPVGSKLMELAAARRWRRDPRARALAFADVFDALFKGPPMATPAEPTPLVQRVEAVPSVAEAQPYRMDQQAAMPEPAPAPTSPTGQAGATSAAPPARAAAPEGAAAHVPRAHTVEDVATALGRYGDAEERVLDKYGVSRQDILEAAQPAGLPGWLEADNAEQVGAYVAGRKAAREGWAPEQLLGKVPRRMAAVALTGFQQYREQASPVAATPRPAGAEGETGAPARAVLTPAPRERLLQELQYRPEDLGDEIILGGQYVVSGQKVTLPDAVPQRLTASGRPMVPVVYAWAPVEAVVPSHREDGTQREDYPLVNTRRYRENREEYAKLVGTIQGWTPELHTVFSPQSAVGPPVVLARAGKFYVVGGNTRAIAIRALPPVTFALHHNAENEFAPVYGLPPAPLDGRRWMIVRLMPNVPAAYTDPNLAALLSDYLNESPGRVQSTLEKALADAAKAPLELAALPAQQLREGRLTTDLVRELIRAGVVDPNTRSALLEHEEEGLLYVRALLMRMAFGERGAAEFRAAETTSSTLLRRMPEMAAQLALELRMAGAEGAVLADYVGEYLSRLLSYGKAERLSQAFTAAAQQIEPGDWRYTAFLQGLGQMLANELVFVPTNKGAKRVESNASEEGIDEVFRSLVDVVRAYDRDAQVGTNLFGEEPNLMRELLTVIRQRVPGVIEALEQLQGRPLGREWGLREEASPYEARAVPPVVMNPDGWERLPPHPLRPILEQMRVVERDNPALARMLERLREQEEVERQEVRAAVDGGTPAEEAIAKVLQRRAGALESQRLGMHRRMRELLRRRDKLTQSEREELRVLERWMGQRYLEFFETEVVGQESEAARKAREEALARWKRRQAQRAAAARADRAMQLLLNYSDPEATAVMKAAQATAMLTHGRPLADLPAETQAELIRLVGDVIEQAHRPAGGELHEPGTLFPTGPGDVEGAGRKRVSRTAPGAPRRVEVASGGVQSFLDFSGLARKRGAGGPPAPEPRRILTRHVKRLPVVTEITHPDLARLVREQVPKSGALLPHQMDGVLRILANWTRGSGHFLLADGTGVGKTRQMLAAAQVAAAHWRQPVILVAPDERVIRDTYAREAAALGVELYRYRGETLGPAHQVLVCTYTDVSRGVVKLEQFATVIFDEAHLLKNDDQLSVRAEMGIRAMNRAERVLLATATPLDEPWQLWYLTKVLGKNPEAALAELGIRVEYRMVNGQERRIYTVEEEHFHPRQVQDWLERNFEEAAARGNYLQRELQLDNIEVGLQQTPLTADQLRAVEDVYQRILNDRVSRGMSLGHAKAVALLAARSHLETYKVQAAYRMVLERLRQGRQVVVYLHRVERVDTAEQPDMRPAQVLAELLEDSLGPNTVGRLYGGLSGTAAQQYAVEVMQRFREGQLPVIIATPQSGGVGLSLDDIYGDAPRSVLVLTAPFGAQDAVQIAGRVSRVTTRSKAEMVFLHTGSRVDTWNLSIVLEKLRYLGAVIGPTAQALAPTGKLTQKPLPPLPPPTAPEPDQVRIDALVHSVPDADFLKSVEWDWWLRLQRQGNLRSRLFRHFWGGEGTGKFSLVGRVIRGPEDLVALGQMLRNPAFEVARLVLVDGKGRVVGVVSTSMGLPGSTKLFEPQNVLALARMARSTGAVAMYTLHNHPSGRVTPSETDITVPRSLLRRKGTEALPRAEPGAQQEYEQAQDILRRIHRADVIIDHLTGTVIMYQLGLPITQRVQVRLSDLPPEYQQWYEAALDKADQEILHGPEFNEEARRRYQEERERSLRVLRGEEAGTPADQFFVPERVAEATPGMVAGKLTMAQEELVPRLLALARAYKPREGRRIPVMALDKANRVRAVVYLHPLEFTNRERCVSLLAQSARLHGAGRFVAVVDDTMGPLVLDAAREYVQHSRQAPQVFMDVVDADRGAGLSTRPYEPPRYAHEELLERGNEPVSNVLREPDVPAYSVRMAGAGGAGGAAGGGGGGVPVALGGMQHVQRFSMPLMVQLYESLMGTRPMVKRVLRGVGVQGSFRTSDGTIRLAAEIFKDPELARKVLAHELGHWVDWNPDQTLARGNLWGRLLSLQNYLKATYGREQVTNAEFRQELIALTKWWRPWDEALVTPRYNQYRKSAKELYADWVSVLFNAPEEARARAPKFWQAFWSHLDTKPDIQRALLDIQAELFADGFQSSDARLVESILQGYRTAEERMLAVAEERRQWARSVRGLMDELAQHLVDSFIPGERMERKALGKRPPTPITAKQRRRPETLHAATEALAMREVVNYRMLQRIHERVMRPLQEAGVSLEELGMYLQMRRIAVGDRATLGNPGGVQPEDAQRLLQMQEARLGTPRFDLLRQAADYFHEVAYQVTRRAVASGLINRRTFETRIQPNRRHYATFWVVKYVSDRITPLVREQVGTFEEVANPFIATVLKLMVTNATIAYNNAARAQVDLLNRYFPNEIKPLKTDRTDTPGKGVIRFLVDGRVQFVEVDRYLAEAFRKRDPHQTWRALQLLRTAFVKLIYPLIITYNFGYLYLVAPWKDLRRTARNLAAARLPVEGGKPGDTTTPTWPSLQLLRRYPQAIADAWRHYYGDDRPIIREMLDNLALGTPWDVFARAGVPVDATAAERDFYVRLLQRSGLASDAEVRGIFGQLRESAFFRPIRKVLDAIEAGGLAINDAPKIAAYRLLVERGLPRHEAARFTRRMAGLPHIHRRGLSVTTFHALIPFWNVFVQGMRADAEAATQPESAGAWWFRWASTDGLFAAMAGAASAGLLGWLLKALFDGIPEYDKRMYNCIPVGIYRDDQGFESVLALWRKGQLGAGSAALPFGWKVVYLRIPRDETSRLTSGILYNVLSYLRPEHDRPGHPLAQALAFGADQVPGVNPFLTIGRAWYEYSRGLAPQDPRTGRPLLNYYEQRAGAPESLAPMFHFTLSQMGVENFIKYDPEAKTTTELAVSAIPGLNRLIKISDYGYHEQQLRRDAAARETELKSEHALRYASEVRRALAEYQRLTSIKPELRTPQQHLRVAEINYWRTNVYRPMDRLILDLERAGKREEARKHREFVAEQAKVLLNILSKPAAPPTPAER
jgi:hypothetical protein